MNIKRNVVANFVGKTWTGILNFLITPVYLKFLGIEAYGLIGFFASLLAISLVLDLGLSTTLNRELARLDGKPASTADVRNLMRSLELVYWAAALVIGCIILLSAHRLATSWLPGSSVGVQEATHAIMLMGLAISLRWVATLYSSGLMGLHKQVLANGISVATMTLQAASAIIAMLLFGRTIVVYFAAQVLAALLQIAALVPCLWHSLPVSNTRARFTLSSIQAVWHFAAGVSGITILSALLTQSDKLLVSKFLSPESFGSYVLAGSIAAALSLPAMALYSALFPALSAASTRSPDDGLSRIYHAGCQTLSVLIVPAGCLITVFSDELLALYVRGTPLAAQTPVVLSILALGNTLLGLMVLPLALQFAAGWTRLSLYKNVIAVVLYIPCVVLAVRSYGAVGAALAWLLLPAGYFLFEIPVMHRLLLVREKWRWYLFDVGLPFAFCALVMVIARSLIPTQMAPQFAIPALLSIWASCVAACLLLFAKWGELKIRAAI